MTPKKALVKRRLKDALPEQMAPYVDAYFSAAGPQIERRIVAILARKAEVAAERRKIEATARAAEVVRAAEVAASSPAAEPEVKNNLIMVYESWDQDPSRLVVSPLTHLGDNFRKYLTATSGLKYVKMPGHVPSQGQEGSLADVAIAVSSLQRNGFEVRAHSDAVARALQKGADVGSSRVREADEHIRRVLSNLDAISARLIAAGKIRRPLVPRPYQLAGIRWLRATPAGALLDEMGLGKTMQWLLAAGDRAVVVTPASVKSTWKRETRLWRPDLKPVVIDGRDSFRWPHKNEIVIVNYDIIRSDSFAVVVVSPGPAPRQTATVLRHLIVGKKKGASETKALAHLSASLQPPFPKMLADGLTYEEAEVLRKTIESAGGKARIETTPGIESLGPPDGPTDLALDEGHVVKNTKTARHKAVKALSLAVEKSGGHRHLITATPLMNRPTELRGVLEAIGAFGTAFKDYKAFSRAFGGNEKSPEAEVQPEAVEALARVALRRVKDEVAKDLPPKTYVDVPVEVDAKTAAQVFAIEKALRPLVEEAEASARRRGASPEQVADAIKAALTKPETIGQTSRARQIIAMAKLPASLELVAGLEKQGRPVLFLSAHSSITDAFKKRRGWVVIDGSVTGNTNEVDDRGEKISKRARIVEDFQAGKHRGIAITIKAGGVGIDLFHAADVVRNDLEWNPALNEQAVDRAHRIGQTKPVTIYTMRAPGWLEARLQELLEQKQALADAAIAPVKDLGGQLPEGPRLSAIQVGAPQGAETLPARWVKIGGDFLIQATREQLEKALASGEPLVVQSSKGPAPVYLLGTIQKGASIYGVPGKRAPTQSDAQLLAKIRVIANDPDADALAKWIVRKADEGGRIPRYVNQQPIDRVIERLEGALPQARKRREAAERRYALDVVPARGDAERFIADALAVLAGSDPDRARERNDVGFAGSTSSEGHRLAAALAQFGGLDPEDWKKAREIVRYHHRQVGEIPA